ncbi:MAG TPA: hypothetical protein VNF49_08650, partial [Candidatus Binataceae bacterium]|nr:hypothetical protein [Candidatus Binataceae bacterium]
MAEEKKSPGISLAALAFAPWLVYGAAAGGNHWRAATGGGLILCLVDLAVLSRRGTVKLMDWTALAYFATASIIMIGLRSAAFPIYQVVVIWSFFAAVAWASVALGQPFTFAYAREQAPPEFWDNPIFHRINWILTLVWCGLL